MPVQIVSHLPNGLVYTPHRKHYSSITGKTGKMVKKNPCLGKHREFGNVVKTPKISFAQVVNSLILKVHDITIFGGMWQTIFAAKFCIFLSDFHI